MNQGTGPKQIAQSSKPDGLNEGQHIEWYYPGQSRSLEVGGVQVTVRFVGRKGRRGRIAITAPPGAVFLNLDRVHRPNSVATVENIRSHASHDQGGALGSTAPMAAWCFVMATCVWTSIALSWSGDLNHYVPATYSTFLDGIH